MWLASILFVGSFIRNPALPGAPGPKGGPDREYSRITRHPMMWSFALWAGVHLAVVGMPKALVFDGAILILALGGAAGQDARSRELMGERLARMDGADGFHPVHPRDRLAGNRRRGRRNDSLLRRHLAASRFPQDSGAGSAKAR